MSVTLDVSFASKEEAAAAASVLEARGAHPQVEGTWVRLLVGSRRLGGKGALFAFCRWALDAQLPVKVGQSTVDCAAIVAAADYRSPDGALELTLLELAELADSMREVRKTLVDTYDHCGYGGVNIDAPTTSVAGGVKYGWQQMSQRLAAAESTADQLRLESTAAMAAADQTAAELRELREVLERAWLPKSLRKKLGIDRRVPTY